MPDLIEIEPCTTSCTLNYSTFQSFQNDNNNNMHNNNNNNSSEQANKHHSYPGMVNNVCNVFGMKPEEYNTKLITETFYSNYSKKRRDSNNNEDDDDDNNDRYNLEKKRKS